MTARPEETTPVGPGQLQVPPEVAADAARLGAVARAVAETLPFGADPADFLAALERLAGEDEDVALPTT
jgi:hypothetical protein